MSEQYLFKPDSFLTSVVLGPDAGPPSVDPRTRLIMASNGTKEGVKKLGEGQDALLVGQKQELQLQARSLREQHRTAESVESLEHTMSDGLGQVSQSLTDGFSGLADGMQQLGNGLQNLGSGMQSGFSHLSNGMSHLAKGVDRGFQTLDRRMQAGLGEVADEVRDASLLNVLSIAALSRNTQAGFGEVTAGIDNLADRMDDNFEMLGLGMQSGFEAMVQVVSDGNEQLGRRLTDGFNAVLTQSDEQHRESVTTLWRGFDGMQQSLGHVAETVVAVGQHNADVIATSTNSLLAGQREQTAALLGALSEVNHNLQHQSANAATEHFVVGMTYLNHLDVKHALEQFSKARQTFAGHFPTLFAEGFCWYVMGRPKLAEDRLIAALSQADADPVRSRKQQAWASLYLGRLSFDRQDYAAALRWFDRSYELNPQLHSALIERAASWLLDPTHPDNAADLIKKKFNSMGESAYRLWYGLALMLATLAPEIAIEAFCHGACRHKAAQQQDRVAVIAMLWRLNRRTAGALLELLEPSYPWLA